VKSATSIFAACWVLLAALPLRADEYRAETLRAINWVENPTNHTRRGSKGELGPYQFRVQTWRMHTQKPFSLATVREHADRVAVQHYEWIKRGLIDAGIDPSPFNIALAWNSGLGSVIRGQVPTVTYNYAERVRNLVEAQVAQRQIAQRRAWHSGEQELSTVVTGSREPTRFGDLIAPNQVQATPHFSLEAPAVQFRVARSDAPRFDLQLAVDSDDVPTVMTDKPNAAAATVVLNLDQPVFTLPISTAPRFALIQ